jgi:hypothetical protein
VDASAQALNQARASESLAKNFFGIGSEDYPIDPKLFAEIAKDAVGLTKDRF